MSHRKPFTKRQRKRIPQHGFGHRPTNNWGEGDLPAPFAAGDVVRQVAEVADGRLRGVRPVEIGDGERYFLVVTVFSVDEGDGWYFRVFGDHPDDCSSDRLHVFYSDRGKQPGDTDYMAAFELVDTADPEGLALRQQMLADGWTHQRDPVCPTCGHHLPPSSVRAVSDTEHPTPGDPQ